MTFLEFSRIISNLSLANQNGGTNLKTNLGRSKLNKLSTSSISIRLWKWILFSNVQQAWWHLQRTWRKNKLILFFEFFSNFLWRSRIFLELLKNFQKNRIFTGFFSQLELKSLDLIKWVKVKGSLKYERNMDTVTSVTVSHEKSWNFVASMSPFNLSVWSMSRF